MTQQPPHPASADPGHTVLEMSKIEFYAEPSPDGYASRVDYAPGERVFVVVDCATIGTVAVADILS
jgi:hypothetical protein